MSGCGRKHSTWSSPELRRRAEAMFLEGSSFKEIANALALPSRFVVSGHLKRAGIFRRDRPVLRWTRPKLKLIWWTPVVRLIWWAPVVDEAPEVEGGWAVIGFVEDLPTERIIASGPDLSPRIVQRNPDPDACWFPWTDTSRNHYRWDEFDWWRPERSSISIAENLPTDA